MDKVEERRFKELMIKRLIRREKMSRRLATEAINTLGLNASWDELVTYGASGEPEAQAELTKRTG